MILVKKEVHGPGKQNSAFAPKYPCGAPTTRNDKYHQMAPIVGENDSLSPFLKLYFKGLT